MRDLLARWFGPDPDTLRAYRTVIPNTLRIYQEPNETGIIITVTEINGNSLDDGTLLITEAKNKDEVVPKVNDLIMSYLDVPVTLRRYYEQDLQLEGHLNKNAKLIKTT